MERVVALLHENGSWVAERVHGCAGLGADLCESMVSGLTLPLLFSLELSFTHPPDLLHNSSDNDPAVDFALSAAALHREHGVQAGAMRTLLKEMRGSYLELAKRLKGDDAIARNLKPALETIFDRIDAALGAE